MAIFISTNMYHADEFPQVLDYVNAFDRQVGVEVFPLFHDPRFYGILEGCLPDLKGLDLSMHGPYYQAEHSAAPGSEAYERTMNLCRQTEHFTHLLPFHHVVYHHNNCRVHPGEEEGLRAVSCANYEEVRRMFAADLTPVLVENVGVADRGNVLFNQEEFTRLCREKQYPVLIDIGHAHANGWDLLRLMEDLKDQILAYHLHNNDGVHDSHQRIHNGSLDFDRFLDLRNDLAVRTGIDTDLVLEYAHDVIPDRRGIEEDIRFVLERAHTG